MQPTLGMTEFMEQARTMQEQLTQAQQQLAGMEVIGRSPDGLVTITFATNGDPVAVRIDAADGIAVERLERGVQAAIAEGNARLHELTSQLIAPMSELMSRMDPELG